MIRRLFVIGLIFLSMFKALSQKGKTIDSLILRTKTIDEPSELVKLNVQIFKYLQRSDLTESKAYLDKAIALAFQEHNDSLRAFVYKNQAEYYLLKNAYDSVFYFAEKAFKFENLLTPKDLVDLYSIKGTTHYYKSEYSKAVSYHLKAEKIADQAGDEMGKARVFNNIAIAYIKVENWVEAEKFLNNSLELCKKYNNKRGISYNLGNLAIVYKNTQQFRKAITTYQEAVEISKVLNDQHAIARNCDNIGALYESQGDFDLALEFYQRSFLIAESLENKSILANTTHNKASVLYKINKYRRAIETYNLSLSLAKTLNNKSLIKNNYFGLSETNEKLGDLKKSLNYRKLYEKYNDSVINENHLKTISELTIKYESEKKEREILTLQSEKVENETTLLRQDNRIRLLTIILLSVCLIFSIVLIVAKQRINNKKQKDIIKAITETQFGERKRIAQDLHDSVGALLAITKSSIENIVQGNDNVEAEVKKSIALLTSSSEQIRKISHNLMPSELIKFGLVSAIESYIHSLNSSDITTHFYPYNMEVQLDDVKQLNLYRIFQEIVQNVLKHSKASELSVYLNNHGKYVDLMVEDNGIGMSKNPKTDSGMGLKSIAYRVKLLEGTLAIDTFNGKGTTVNVKIPI